MIYFKFFLSFIKGSLFQESIDNFDLSLFDNKVKIEKNVDQEPLTYSHRLPNSHIDIKSHEGIKSEFPTKVCVSNNENKHIVENEGCALTRLLDYKSCANILCDFEHQLLNIVSGKGDKLISSPSSAECKMYENLTFPLSDLKIFINNLLRNISIIPKQEIDDSKNNDLIQWLDLLKNLILFISRYDDINPDSHKVPADTLLKVKRNNKILEILEIINVQYIISKIESIADKNKIESLFIIKNEIDVLYLNINIYKKRLNLIYIFLVGQLIF
ncbi:uncharacterized protein VNE69_12172 [Vairimorpha necatrix]|uniref:Uncharacterized protein n=1 Tax=Vairimorpha necatrix TaxID=6039 RepID=A0AAX4JGW0_9MICR